MVKSAKKRIKMANSAPLASQGKLLDEKTNVEIIIRRVELVSIAMDTIGNGRWQKELRKRNGMFCVEMYVV